MRNRRSVRLVLTGASLLLTVLSLAPAGASSANISHSYHAGTSISGGSIVSLDPTRSDYVEPANVDNGSRLLGVAVASDDSLLAVDPGVDTVQIATSGNANTLVSTLSGDVDVGDQIAVSPFNGIGMKAVPGSHVIGLAQTAFSSSSDGATTRQITDKSGHNKAVQVGYVRVSIAIGTSSAAGSGSEGSGLQRLARSLTGHAVSTPRVIVSLIVALVALVALITLIYASIYGSIISVGRNPLAKYTIFRTLGSVLGMAALTAVIAGLTIFFLLR